MLHVLEPVFFMLTTISSSVPLAVALKARWGTLHLAPDVEDLAWAAEPLPLLEPVEPVEPVEPEEEEPEVEPWPPVEVLPVVELLAPVELLAVVEALVLAEALDPSPLLHAVNERPAAATMRARADIFLTRIGTPGKRCRIGRSLRLSGRGCFIGSACRATRCGRDHTKTPL
jgi:hypothetical protein